ncbi:Alpha-soluble NSF attachment protein [Vitis vinifera]|uniref:Alpha-soluble NSF attachment protein n=1 Tax=Vitis vinifera TaxID=29760 RepID=A0A438E3R4_VITVI|nr:Alpha-soluble NSF attachment protein [Vitis vinifera]
MADNIQRGEEFEKKAEKKISGWGLFGSKYEDAADFYDKAANCFKLAKSWDRAGSTYVKLSNCYTKLDSKHEAAQAYADAGHCYKKTSAKVLINIFFFAEAISCLEQAANLFLDNGRFNMAGKYYKLIFIKVKEATTAANQCNAKVAQFAAQLEQYQKAIQIYEDIGRQSLNNNLLKYGVKGHLLNAGICQLCKGDVVAITNALDRYQEMDPTFSGTREYKLLVDLAAAVDEEDVVKFTDAVKEFDSMTQLSCIDIESVTVGWISGHDIGTESQSTHSETKWGLVDKVLSQLTIQSPLSFQTPIGSFKTHSPMDILLDSLHLFILFDSTAQDAWKTTLLLRVKEAIKAKELEEDDLT